MFFNYDSLVFAGFVGTSILVGGIFTYSIYTMFTATIIYNNESLVNTQQSTVSNSNLSKLDINLINAEVQTDAEILVAPQTTDTGMQTSSRMWMSSIRNWIDEILRNPNPNPNPNYVDVGVQTNIPGSLYLTVKNWFIDTFSIRSEDLTSIGHNRVNKWRTNLEIMIKTRCIRSNS